MRARERLLATGLGLWSLVVACEDRDLPIGEGPLGGATFFGGNAGADAGAAVSGGRAGSATNGGVGGVVSSGGRSGSGGATGSGGDGSGLDAGAGGRPPLGGASSAGSGGTAEGGGGDGAGGAGNGQGAEAGLGAAGGSAGAGLAGADGTGGRANVTCPGLPTAFCPSFAAGAGGLGAAGRESRSLITSFGPNFDARAINDVGQVIGNQLNCSRVDAEDPVRRALLFDVGGARALRMPANAIESRAFDINEVGDVVGTIDASAYLWRGNDAILLRTPGSARAINRSGQVVVLVEAPNAITSYLWAGGQLTDLDPERRYLQLAALDINDAGAIVGWLEAAVGTGSVQRPFVWRAGNLTILPVPDDSQPGAAVEINSRGEILGDWAGHVVLWQPDFTLTDISALIGDPSRFGVNGDEPIALNDAGELVLQIRQPSAPEDGFQLFAEGRFEHQLKNVVDLSNLGDILLSGTQSVALTRLCVAACCGG